MSKSAPSVVIVGAGLGGLASGAYLAKHGARVTVLEKLPKPGGVLDTFCRGGYTFEATTHQTANLSTMTELLESLGLEDLEVVTMDALYEALLVAENRIVERHVLPAGHERFARYLYDQWPEHHQSVTGYLEAIHNIRRDLQRLVTVRSSKSIWPVFFDALFALMLKKGRPGGVLSAVGRRAYPHLTRHASWSYQQLVDELPHELQWLLSQYWPYLGAPPSKLSALLLGYFYDLYVCSSPVLVKGGAKALVDRLHAVITDHGGQVICESPVRQIVVENGVARGVVVDSGAVYRADVVVSNVSVWRTVSELVGTEHMPSSYVSQVQELEPSPSMFQVYVGLPRQLEEFGFGAKTSFFSFNRDIHEDWRVAINGPSECSPFIVSNYSKGEPSFAPSGGTSFVIGELDTIDNWGTASRDEYRARKARIQDVILQKFEKITGIPVRAEAKVLFSATPKTLQRYMSNLQGECVGYPGTVKHSLHRRLAPQTPVKNLALVGACTQPFAGLSAVLSGSALSAKEIMSRW